MSTDSNNKVQVAVIGGGPGGYAAAFEAAELGLDVALITEEPRLGGVCLHRGCIPSKALLHIARLIYEARDSQHWGITFGAPQIDLEKLRSWKSGIIDKLAGGVGELCRIRKVRMINARGTFLDSRTLRLDKSDGQQDRLQFEHAILASGSTPVIPGDFNIGDPRIMDSTSGLELREIPGTLLVIGGGYIGLEMGTMYSALGSRVTVVELTGGLIPGVDRDLLRPLQKRLKGMFEAIHLNTKVESLERRDDGILVHMTGEGVPPQQLFDRVLIAVGRKPNSKGLGLETTGVKVNPKGFVQVDRAQRTDDPHILAIGDVVGEPLLAHKASREGKIAAEVLAGEAAEFDNLAIPAVIFTDPEIAWCGLSENQAEADGREIKVAKFPWSASGRATTIDRPEGLTKLIIDPDTERVLGMGIVGSNAGELIAEGALAVEMAALATDIAEAIHPHPTLSETILESAESYFGRATHLYRPKR